MRIKNLKNWYSISFKNLGLHLYKPNFIFRILKFGCWFDFINGEALIGISTPFFRFTYFPYDFWGQM